MKSNNNDHPWRKSKEVLLSLVNDEAKEHWLSLGLRGAKGWGSKNF